MMSADFGIESDADVVVRTRSDREYFAVLITRYADKLGRYLTRLGVRRPEDREDLLQDIFIKVYRNLNAYDTARSFSSWIYRIAHNETMSWFRKKQARPEYILTEDSEVALSLLAEGDASPRTTDAYDTEEITAALAKLPEKYRRVMVLRYFEEKSYEEIADILMIPVGSVATLVHRAKARLRDIMSHV